MVTGAGKGIGFETVISFLESDSNIKVIALSRNVSQLMDIQHDNLIVVKSDLMKITESEIEQIFIDNNLSQLDILINNAAQLINKSFDDLSVDEFRYMFEINFFSQIKLIKVCMPFLLSAQSAHVLNISSMGAMQGSQKFPGLSAYSSSKAALTTLTECLAEEFKDKSIRFNCLALGSVNTEMLNQAFPNYKASTSPRQMADFIEQFSSQLPNIINGKIIPVSVSTP